MSLLRPSRGLRGPRRAQPPQRSDDAVALKSATAPSLLPSILRYGPRKQLGRGASGLAAASGIPVAGVYLYSAAVDALASFEMAVFAHTVSVLGTLEACEVVKLVTGAGEPLIGRLLLVDILGMRFETIGYGRA